MVNKRIPIWLQPNWAIILKEIQEKRPDCDGNLETVKVALRKLWEESRNLPKKNKK